jgi:4-hydroxy-tetrahydrodipicolinate synthase
MAGKKYRGIYAMLVTPFNKDEEVDHGALRAEIDWCAAEGVDGVVATPSIGEFACLTKEERWRCFETVAEQTQKYPKLVKFATIAAPYTREVLEHARACKELGYSGAQLIPPYYWVPDESEVYRHYQLAAESGVPIIVYHNPALSKFHMSRGFLGRLADIPGVIGVKEVKTDRQIDLEPLFHLVKDRVAVFTTFRVFTTGLILGSSGGFINAFAVPACVKMWRLFQTLGTPAGEENRRKMEQIQNLVNEVFPRGGESNKRHIGTTKLATTVVSGVNMGPPRAPYMLPEAPVEKKLRETWPQLKALLV